MADKKKILVIDDEEGFLSLIKDALELRGVEVVTASNAIAAGLEIASKNPDLVLMDINMPGINGLQACAAIRRNPDTKKMPIIIVSAMADESDKKKAYACGVSDYFIKPVDIEKLVARVKEIIK